MKSAQSNEKGASLVTVMVGLVITAIIALAAMDVLSHLQTNLILLTNKTNENDDFAAFKGFYEKSIMRSDMHFYGFTDDPAQPIVRAMIPAPGMCADLSSCPESVALAFAYFNDRISPFITAVCAFPTNPPQILVDTQADPLNTVANAGAAFTVNGGRPTAVNGTVQTQVGSILAMGDTPQFTMWTVRGAPATVNFSYDATTKLFSDPRIQANPDCSSSLNLNVNGVYNNRFYAIPVAPLQISNFFSNVNLLAAANGMAEFPIRVMNMEFITVGQMPAAGNRPARLAALGCQVAGGNTLNCNEERFFINNVSKVRVGASFSPGLQTGGPQPAVWDIYRAGQAPCEGVTETCAGLQQTTIPSDPRSMIPGETYERLLANEFSLIKLEKLARLKLRFLVNRQKRFENQGVEQTQQWETVDNAIP